MIIKQTEKKLIIENYQNKVNNLALFDVIDNFEQQGIRIVMQNDLPTIIYNKRKYIVEDKHIAKLENSNIVEFKGVK